MHPIPARNTPAAGWLPFLLGLSGATGLGLQLVWTRRLGLIAGHEYPATLAVITGFFAGLAIGAALSRRWLHRFPALRLAALAESTIALWSLLTIPLLPSLDGVFRGIDPLIWAGLSLLPATVAMGTILPLFERAAANRSPGVPSQSRLATLYAANTLGGVAGVALTVWLAMPVWGLTRTTLALAAGSAFNALILAWTAGRRTPRPGHPASPAAATTATAVPAITHPSAASLPVSLAIFAGTTGFLGLAYEVLGVRLLSQSLEGTVYTYAVTLMVYLLGTAVGAGVVGLFSRPTHASRPRSFPENNRGLLVGLILSLVVGGLVLSQSLPLFEWLRRHWGDSPFAVTAAEGVLAAGVFGLPTFFMGALFTRLLAGAAAHREGTGTAIAWNLLGGVVAPGLVGALAFPALGGRGTLMLILAGYASLIPGRPIMALATALAIGVTGRVLLPPLDLQLRPRDGRIVTLRAGAADTVCVIEPAPGQRTLRVNNRYTMGGTASAHAEQRHAHIPLLLHPNPKDALFLGVGTGISFAAMRTHPGLQSTGIELVPEVAASQPEFAPFNTLGPKQTLQVADARRYVRTTTNRYDVIVADLFHPGRDGAGALYTQEHFALIRQRLQPHGLFCQWLPLYQLNAPTLRCIVRTFLSVFPDTDACWLRPNADVPVLGLVGWSERPRYTNNWVRRRMTTEDLPKALRDIGMVHDFQLFGLWFADAQWLHSWAYADGGNLNTDDRPVVLFTAPSATYSRTVPGYALLQELLNASGPAPRLPHWLTEVDSTIGTGPGAVRWSAYYQARDHYLAGLIDETAGRSAEAEAKFIASARMSADFTTGYAQVISRAALLQASQPAAARRLLEALIDARPEVPVARQLLERMP